MSEQSPNAVVMIRPHNFTPNPETAADNSFQRKATEANAAIAQKAYDEVTSVAKSLSSVGINVHLFEDEGITTPDSVFPNNWFSTHASGEVILYPMYAPNRRLERRKDIIEDLSKTYQVSKVTDLSYFEQQGQFLEGTGAIVFDHDAKLAYAVRSNRCDENTLNHLCKHIGYAPVCFDAVDETGSAVYHTNVIMCVGSHFVMLADSMIENSSQRSQVLDAIEKSGKDLISLSHQQISQFCGNALELDAQQGLILAMSKTAFEGLTTTQISIIEKSVEIVSFDVKTIELAGGSLRCMLAGIHLKK